VHWVWQKTTLDEYTLCCKFNPSKTKAIFYQKSLKIAIFVAFIQENKKNTLLGTNHRNLYITCLRSHNKNFMKFDRIDWKILAFKLGKTIFLEHWHAISNDFNFHLWKFQHYWLWVKKKFVLKNWVESLGKTFPQKISWFSFFKKLLSRSRSKIKGKTKSLIALIWDWNTIIPTTRLF